jgi:hypothetical protein
MNQQPLSGMEIRILAQRIVRINQDSDVSIERDIEEILKDYILIPKYKINDQAGSLKD